MFPDEFLIVNSICHYFESWDKAYIMTIGGTMYRIETLCLCIVSKKEGKVNLLRVTTGVLRYVEQWRTTIKP